MSALRTLGDALVTAALVVTPPLAVAVTYLLAASLNDGGGLRTERPVAQLALQPHYRLGAGTLRLDLRGLRSAKPTAGPRCVRASVTVGRLEVLLSPRSLVLIDANVGAGRLDLLGRRNTGLRIDKHHRDPNYAMLAADKKGTRPEMCLDVPPAELPKGKRGTRTRLELELRVRAGSIRVQRARPQSAAGT